MKNSYLLITIIFSGLMMACNNNKETKPELRTFIKPNGDSLITQVNEYGNYNGPFTAYYHNKTFATGFFKNGYRDSIYILYSQGGKSKLITYYINGYQEGKSYKFDLQDSTESIQIFYRHDTARIVSKISYSSDDLVNKEIQKFFLIENDEWIHIGNLVFRNNEFSPSESNYYIISVNGLSNEKKVLPLGKESVISIDFFETDSNLIAKIADVFITGPKSGKNYPFKINTINYKKSAHFDMIISPVERGWYFVEGTIKIVYLKKELERSVPVYFNYYVY